MKSILLFFIVSSSSIVFGQFNVVFVSNNDSSSIYNIVSQLVENKKFKSVHFRAVDFNEKSSSKSSWPFKNNIVDLRKEKMSCDFNFCSEMTDLINTDFSNHIYFYSKNPLTCSFSEVKIEETIINNSFSFDFINEKIKQQFELFKKNKKSTTLYFNFTDLTKGRTQPEISLDIEEYDMKKGETINLNLKLSSPHQSITWEPQVGLNCYNCLSPELKAEKSVSYTVQYFDMNGCPSNIQEINIKVIDDCDLSKKITIPFGKINYSNIKSVEGEDFEYEITPIGAGGGFKYDIPTTRNCAESFKFIIKDLNAKTVVVFNKKRDEIDENSNNPFVNDNPEYFVFRINLQDYYKYIQLGATITIESYDEKGNTYKSYTSPIISFSGCK